MQTSPLKLGLRLGKNTLWLFLARFGAQILMMAFTVIVARRLGEVGLGQYAFVASAVFLANAFTSFGSDMLIIREIAARKDFTLLPAALAVQLALAAVFVALLIAVAPALPRQADEAVRALQIYSVALFPLAFFTVCSAVLRGYEYMDVIMWLNLATAVLQLTGAWLIVQPGSSVVHLAWLLLGCQTAVALLAAYLCLARIPELRRRYTVSRRAIWRLVRASAPIALLGLLGMLFQKLTVYMLATLDGAAVTGWYSAAMRTVDASKMGHAAVFGALFPAMSLVQDGAGRQAPQWQRIFSYSWKFLLALAVLAALALFSLADLLISLLYGADFAASVPALRILAWTLIPYTINTYLSLAYLSAAEERRVVVALAGGLAALAVLNAAWIGRYGLIGACWATLAGAWVQSGIFGLQIMPWRIVR